MRTFPSYWTFRTPIGVVIGAALCISGGGTRPPCAQAQGAAQGASPSAHLEGSRPADGHVPSPRFPVTYPDPRGTLSLPTDADFTASDVIFDLRTERRYAFWRTRPEAPSMASDSIRTAVEARGQSWLQTLRMSAPDALHMDDAGRVHVVAQQDSVAQRIFAQRLAMPGLSVLDRAFTLHAAALSFADTTHPDRLRIAEAYSAALDSVSARDARVYGFHAHLVLAGAYDGLDRREAALRHALHALGTLPRLPFKDREDAYADPALYMIAAHALQDEPNGRARLDSLRVAFKRATELLPGMTPADSAAVAERLFWPDSADRISGSAGLLGQPAPAIYAHATMNMPASSSLRTDSAAITLNDGVVRLVLFGNVYCCLDAVISLQRLQRSFPPGASALFATATAGYIYGVLIPPKQEVAELRSIFLDTLKITYPIALWAAAKRETKSGGMVASSNENLAAYFVSRDKYGNTGYSTAPYLAIIDGKGIVRHIFSAERGFTRDDQQRAVALIRDLIAKKKS